jgi:hypothetical protein
VSGGAYEWTAAAGTLRRHRGRLLAATAIALVLAGIGGYLDPGAFMRMWLVAALYWIALPLGAMPVLMTYHLTGGGWGEATEGITRAAIATLPVGAVAFLVPMVFGLHSLYPWTADSVALEHVVVHKLPYLNIPFFIARTLFFFAIWLILAWRIEAWRRTAGPHPRLGAGGPVLWVLTTTFFCIDWIMSLQPHFYSDEFGLFFGAGLVVPAMALIALIQARRTPAEDDRAASRLQDFANLLLSAVLGWVFFDFAQYLIIWMGNMPDEIVWFVDRGSAGWRAVARFVLFAFFIVPTAAFLFRRVKRSPRAMTAIALLILVGHYANCAWMIMPNAPADGLGSGLIGVVAWLGIGGAWLIVFLDRLAFISEAVAPRTLQPENAT